MVSFVPRAPARLVVAVLTLAGASLGALDASPARAALSTAVLCGGYLHPNCPGRPTPPSSPDAAQAPRRLSVPGSVRAPRPPRGSLSGGFIADGGGAAPDGGPGALPPLGAGGGDLPGVGASPDPKLAPIGGGTPPDLTPGVKPGGDDRPRHTSRGGRNDILFESLVIVRGVGDINANIDLRAYARYLQSLEVTLRPGGENARCPVEIRRVGASRYQQAVLPFSQDATASATWRLPALEFVNLVNLLLLKLDREDAKCLLTIRDVTGATPAPGPSPLHLKVNGPDVRGHIRHGGDISLFTFRAGSDGDFTISTKGSTPVIFRIYGPNSPNLLVAESDVSSDDHGARLNDLHLIRGLYWIQVFHADRQNGTGSFEIRVKGKGDDDDPGNTLPPGNGPQGGGPADKPKDPTLPPGGGDPTSPGGGPAGGAGGTTTPPPDAGGSTLPPGGGATPPGGGAAPGGAAPGGGPTPDAGAGGAAPGGATPGGATPGGGAALPPIGGATPDPTTPGGGPATPGFSPLPGTPGGATPGAPGGTNPTPPAGNETRGLRHPLPPSAPVPPAPAARGV